MWNMTGYLKNLSFEVWKDVDEILKYAGTNIGASIMIIFDLNNRNWLEIGMLCPLTIFIL